MAENYTTVREAIEWVSTRWHDEEETVGLPRILLVGDSIVVGHGTMLCEKFKGKYGVDFFATSKIVSDRDFLPDLKFMLKKYQYDMIIFNNGLHGIKVDDPVYARSLKRVLAYLQKQTGHLVWRNNTPCFPTPERKTAQAWVDRVPARNALALEVVKALGIPVIDAFSLLKNKPEFSSDGVHFTTEGYALLVDKEVSYIKQYFKKKGVK